MTFVELKNKANNLPLSPGVYIMRDVDNVVIYVGKAKKLKNRVSQYFLNTESHSPKTKLMVNKIDHFDVIVASSEFEALVLECSLIKQHMPKYNILLKDDKGYPYIRLDMNAAYPRLSVAAKPLKDKAEYYGPFGNRGITQEIIDTILSILSLPKCKKEFPRDIGKDRPCLNYHMNQCSGWCQAGKDVREYLNLIDHARSLLNGNYKQVYNSVRNQMLSAADDMNFELAATLRDRMNSIEALGKKQLVTAVSKADTDVIGYGQSDAKGCISILHYSNGMLIDKEYEVFPIPDDPSDAVCSLVKQYYYKKESAPKNIYLPFPMEDAELVTQLFLQKFGVKTNIHVPIRGEKKKMLDIAVINATEEANRVTGIEEKQNAKLTLLGNMLCIDTPKRIEAFDISNISGTDIVAGMVVFVDGKPKKSEYKKFKINGLEDQDDYHSMQQTVQRRFMRYIDNDAGFSDLPDLVLIDGGAEHAKIAHQMILTMDINVPVFGMVKDDKHRTRALVTPDGREISIDTNQSIFSFIGTIQEETHRYAINYHKQLRSKHLKYSELDNIAGIGSKRKETLLKYFHSISAIRSATLDELRRILPKDSASAVYNHYHTTEE